MVFDTGVCESVKIGTNGRLNGWVVKRDSIAPTPKAINICI